MIAVAAWALAGCLAVNPASDRILAVELAPAFPAMADAPADAVAGLAPAPGVQRVFPAAELRRLASRWHIAGEPTGDLCFARRVAALDPARLLDAMRRALPDSHIEILETSRLPVPEGELEFPRAGLRRGANGALWTGWVRYGGNRRYTLWARVNVSMKVERVTAAVDLLPGKPIAESDVRVVAVDEAPDAAGFASSLAEVVGRVPRTAIRAGARIAARQLDAPRDVVRGDTVMVEVLNGAASLKLEAKAEGSGAAGDTVLVRNPASHKSFRARVEGKGRVSVDAAQIRGNP